MLNRKKIDADARSWLGVKFKKGGRDRTGIDCVGLLVKVAESNDIIVTDILDYSFDPEPGKFSEFVHSQSEPHSRKDLQIGCILIFKQTIFPMHTGILSRDIYGRWSVINANIKERRVVEQPLDQWHKDLIDIRDFKET
jgi:hypothetical protein